MTRGRRAYTALRDAIRIAEKRGEVRQFQYEPDMLCNFVIYFPGGVAHARMKRIPRLRCSHAIIEREAREDLEILRSIAYVAGISRELWIYSPKGSFRIFRVCDDKLIELGRDGLVLPGPVAGKVPAAIPVPAPLTGPVGSPAVIPDPGIITGASVGEKVLPEGRGTEKPTP
jgi:hypothetical protein